MLTNDKFEKVPTSEIEKFVKDNYQQGVNNTPPTNTAKFSRAYGLWSMASRVGSVFWTRSR